MGYGAKLHVWGDWACFTRPEAKVERYSYDVMTPSAARGILEAVYWKPEITWIIDRIHVLNPLKFEGFRRNEVDRKASGSTAKTAMKRSDTAGLPIAAEECRVQRASMVLRDVAYVIEAHFRIKASGSNGGETGKHRETFRRRAGRGQCHHRPYLGTREFAAYFDLVEDRMPESKLLDGERDRDLGWMLLDIEHSRGKATPLFFNAHMRDGVLEIPNRGSPEVRS